MAKVFTVTPISAGYSHAITIGYAKSISDLFPILANRLLVHFKTRVEDPTPIFVLDTSLVPSCITRTNLGVDGVQLDLNLTPEQTNLIVSKVVCFDIAVFNGSAPLPVPGKWSWPVEQRVTRP